MFVYVKNLDQPHEKTTSKCNIVEPVKKALTRVGRQIRWCGKEAIFRDVSRGVETINCDTE